MKHFTEFMNEGKFNNESTYFQNCKSLVMNDGTTLSIQASQGHYCSPRTNFTSYENYDSFEIGFPTRKIDLLMEYAEDPENPEDTVYGWVPKGVVEKVIEECGGVNKIKD